MKYFNYVLIALLLIACDDGVNYSNEKSTSANNAGFVFEDAELTESTPITYRITPPQGEVQQQKIIKTGNLRFETQDIAATHKNIKYLAQQYKGFIAKDNSGKNYNELYRNMTVRVPSKNFQYVVDGISKGVAYFDERTISQRDVGEEFVDLEARLKAKRELEIRYLQLLTKAKNVKEMLEIEQQLSKIREEIEAKQGRLKYLQNQVSLSTITIYFYKTTAQTGITQSYGQKMKNALKGGWDGVSMFFLGILTIWPLFLVLIIVILVVRRILKRKKRSN